MRKEESQEGKKERKRRGGRELGRRDREAKGAWGEEEKKKERKRSVLEGQNINGVIFRNYL